MPNPTPIFVPIVIAVVRVCRAFHPHNGLSLYHLGYHNHTGGVCCNRGLPRQRCVRAGAAMRPAHANAHARTYAESLECLEFSPVEPELHDILPITIKNQN